FITYVRTLIGSFSFLAVWMVQGRSFEVSIDDEEASLMEGSTKAEGFSVVCKACQWALKRVKKMIGPNATAEKVTQVLKNVCDGAGPLKKKCHSFVDSHLRELVKELLTDDGVRTICIKTRASETELLKLKEAEYELKRWLKIAKCWVEVKSSKRLAESVIRSARS
uniref:Antimicrobial peptide NK-lysin-like n=1 Tax=Kryptolebias marmoratus TaxID=37003 RepID=A0A3Q3AK10_KRYMA